MGICSYISYGRFKSFKNVGNFDVNSVSENISIGYILEVDLKNPDELHELHNYPLSPKKTCNSLWNFVRLL